MAIELTTATEQQKQEIRTALLSGADYSIEAGSADGNSFFKLKAIRSLDRNFYGDWESADYIANDPSGGIIRINGINDEYVRGFFQWALQNENNWAGPLTCYINDDSGNVFNIENVNVNNRSNIPEVEIFVTQQPESTVVVNSIHFQDLKFINKVENDGSNILISAANEIRLTSINQDIELRSTDDIFIETGDELELSSDRSDVQIYTNANTSQENGWRFTNEGTFSQQPSAGFAGFMQWKGESSGDGNNYTTLELHPDQSRSSSDQYVIIDPTAPNHIHIRAGGAIDNSGAELTIGGETGYFKVGAGAQPTVTIQSPYQAVIAINDPEDGYKQWLYDIDGVDMALGPDGANKDSRIRQQGAITKVFGDPYQQYIGINNSDIIYKSTNANIGTAKISVRVQYNSNVANEFADVIVCRDASDTFNYIVTNRVRSDGSTNFIRLSAGTDAGSIVLSAIEIPDDAYFNVHVTEFERTFD